MPHCASQQSFHVRLLGHFTVSHAGPLMLFLSWQSPKQACSQALTTRPCRLGPSHKLTVKPEATHLCHGLRNKCCSCHMSAVQDEVTNFRPSGADLDYPGKLQQQQDGAPEQTPLTQQNGNAPAASVPQQNTDPQVGACAHTPFTLCIPYLLMVVSVRPDPMHPYSAYICDVSLLVPWSCCHRLAFACRWRAIWKPAEFGTLQCAAPCCACPSCMAVWTPRSSMVSRRMLCTLPLSVSRSGSCPPTLDLSPSTDTGTCN